MRALNPSHAATDGLISKGFFVYFHPIDSPLLVPAVTKGVALSAASFLIDYKIATRSLVIGRLSIGD